MRGPRGTIRSMNQISKTLSFKLNLTRDGHGLFIGRVFFFFNKSDHYHYISLYWVTLSCKEKKEKRKEINYKTHAFERKVIYK